MPASSAAWPQYLLNMKRGDVLIAFDVRRYDQRLADFAALAEKVAATVTSGSTFGPGTDLEAIKALHILQVGEFIVDQPESRSCYGFCNPSNQTRESQLQAIKEAL